MDFQSSKEFDFHYLDYLYAMSKFYQQDYVTAQEFFLRYTSNFHGSNYIKSANHKLFLISFLTDSADNISKYRNLVLEKGNALIDEDDLTLAATLISKAVDGFSKLTVFVT